MCCAISAFAFLFSPMPVTLDLHMSLAVLVSLFDEYFFYDYHARK